MAGFGHRVLVRHQIDGCPVWPAPPIYLTPQRIRFGQQLLAGLDGPRGPARFLLEEGVIQGQDDGHRAAAVSDHLRARFSRAFCRPSVASFFDWRTATRAVVLS